MMLSDITTNILCSGLEIFILGLSKLKKRHSRTGHVAWNWSSEFTLHHSKLLVPVYLTSPHWFDFMKFIWKFTFHFLSPSSQARFLPILLTLISFDVIKFRWIFLHLANGWYHGSFVYLGSVSWNCQIQKFAFRNCFKNCSLCCDSKFCSPSFSFHCSPSFLSFPY